MHHGGFFRVFPGDGIYGIESEVIAVGIGKLYICQHAVLILHTPNKAVAKELCLFHLPLGAGRQLQGGVPLVAGHNH